MPVNLWWKLLKDTKYKARSASTMSDILSRNVATRISDLHEDVTHISTKVSEFEDQHTVWYSKNVSRYQHESRFRIELRQSHSLYSNSL